MSAPLLKTLGRYEIESEIGRGMMGVVYQARDPALDRVVALKTINLSFAISEAERDVFEQRFMSEARLAAGLSHPNIVVVHDVGRDETTRTPYIALEFLKGKLLSEMIPPPMAWREALRITGRLADALHVAHAASIVHRDIKPANVMVLASGEPKVMDFGIARAPASNLTAAGEFFGTPSYMSPEQASGDTLDGRSDLFSLGAVLYFLLTGERAFEGKSVPAILAKVEREDPARPSSLVAEIPPAVDAIVQQLLEKAPANRYQDGTELGEDIADVLEDRAPRHASQHPLLADPTLGRRHAPDAVGTRSGVETRLIKSLQGPRGLLAVAALLLAALIATLMLPTTPAPPAVMVSAPPINAPSAGPTPTGAGTPLPSAPNLAGSPGATAKPASEPPVTGPSDRPGTSRDVARLTLAIEHNLKDGTLRVLVDQRQVLSKLLTSKETKKALIFKGRKGQLVEVLDLTPGQHLIRVEATEKGDPDPRTGNIPGSFKKGETRLLEVKIGGRVELAWRE